MNGTMNLPRISLLVDKLDFALLCWDDRYGKGIWACCLPGYSYCQSIRDASVDGDLDMFPATDYLLDSIWLPVLTGSTLLDALSLLEARLGTLDASQLAKESDWWWATVAALDHFEEIQEAFKDKLYNAPYRHLPADFSIVARSRERQQKEGGDLMW